MIGSRPFARFGFDPLSFILPLTKPFLRLPSVHQSNWTHRSMFHSTLTVHSSGRRLCSHSDPASPQIHHNQLIWATITTHWFRECKYLATRWHVPIHGSRDMTAEFFIIWRFSGFGLSIGTTVLPIWLVVRVPVLRTGSQNYRVSWSIDGFPSKGLPYSKYAFVG